MSTSSELIESARAILSVSCPSCGAARGNRCLRLVDTGRWLQPTSDPQEEVHKGRLEAWREAGEQEKEARATGLHEVGDAAAQVKALADSKDREIERLRAVGRLAVCPSCHRRKEAKRYDYALEKYVPCRHEFHRLATEAGL